jgi:SH3-like domain-containing protein
VPQPRIRIWLGLWLLGQFLPIAAWAQDYRSVLVPKAILYDAPSAQARKLFVVSRQYPLEVIVNLGEWIKVRDSTGGLAWIESKDVSTNRSLLVTASQAEVHESMDEASPLVFRVEKDVTLQLVEAGSNGWAKVRHRDGLTGYVQFSKVWGL